MFTDFFLLFQKRTTRKTWKNVSCMCVDQICLRLLFLFFFAVL